MNGNIIINDLIVATTEMRQAQRNFIMTRSKTWLHKAQLFEKRVDNLLKNFRIHNGSAVYNPTLF